MNCSLAPAGIAHEPKSRIPSRTNRNSFARRESSFELCVALIRAQRSHSRLLDELDQLRERKRRAIAYRGENLPGRQFRDAYLAHLQDRIDRTLRRLEGSRARAHALIVLAEAVEPSGPNRGSRDPRSRRGRNLSTPDRPAWGRSRGSL
jgi:hypothetical protein